MSTISTRLAQALERAATNHDKNYILSRGMRRDLWQFIMVNLPAWQECADVDCDYYLELTIACNDTGTQWNYQTGDNSFTGGCYGLPHWATYIVTESDTVRAVWVSIVDQLDQLLATVGEMA